MPRNYLPQKTCRKNRLYWKAGLFALLFVTGVFCRQSQAKEEPKTKVLRIATLLSYLDAYRDRRITLVGHIRVGEVLVRGSHSFQSRGAICTQLDCGPQACCNTCSAPASLVDDKNLGFAIVLRGIFLGKKIACGGLECKLECNPTLGKMYRVTGTLLLEKKVSGYRRAVLLVSNISVIKKQRKEQKKE